MTQMDGSRTPELREDAAMWFALMRGPEAETRRVEFEIATRRGELKRAAEKL